MSSVEKFLKMKDTTELSSNVRSVKSGNEKVPDKAAQLRWLLLLWAGSVAALGVVAAIIWLLMHSAGMTR